MRSNSTKFTFESSSSEDDSENEDDREFINDSDESDDVDYTSVVKKFIYSRERKRQG